MAVQPPLSSSSTSTPASSPPPRTSPPTPPTSPGTSASSPPPAPSTPPSVGSIRSDPFPSPSQSPDLVCSVAAVLHGGAVRRRERPRGEGEVEGDAEAFLACAYSSELRVVSAADASSIREPIDGDSEAVTGIALCLDSRLLFVAGHSKLIRV
ncbi:hypothetical protein ZWY2020_024563 [Hordeum vulgare]|nr:hypothetical protein ZWY2020_024563 [Hordeum vulgare]